MPGPIRINHGASLARTALGLMVAAGGMVALAGLSGCQDSSAAPESISDRQDSMLKNPMNYSLKWDTPDISGGGITEYHSQAMQKDLNDVFNP
jgi:hypothetical protein